MPNIPSRGWYARVTPASGHVHEPSIIQSDAINPQQTPQANAVPRIRLPVPKDDRWRDILGDGTTDVDLDVYHDGARQPIDTLVDVEDAPGHTVLVGEGGRELRTRVEASYDQRAVHLAAQDLIDNNTTYDSNVDTPTTTTETNTTLVTLTSTSDFLTRADALFDTWPVGVDSGTLKLFQTCFTAEAESPDSSSGITTDPQAGSQYSGNEGSNQGAAAQFNSGSDFAEYNFTTEYVIPAEDFEVAVRWGQTSSTSNEATLTVKLDGNTLGTWDVTGTNQISWDNLIGGNKISAPSSDIQPGAHTLRFEVASVNTQAKRVDVVAPHDTGGTRFTPSYTFDNTLTNGDDGGTYLAGPELYPDGFIVAFDAVPAPQAVTGIRAEGTITNDASNYTHHVSNDQGANFTTGTGANFETDSLGTTWGPGVTYKAGLSRTGSRTNGTPTSGFNGTDLQSLTLKADLEDIPLVVNRTFDGHLDTILRELANMGDQLWEYRNDAGTESIEWTSPGQRTATQTPGVGDYQATKTTGEVYQKAIVYGQPDTPTRSERFESNHGVAVSLENGRIQQGTDRVVDIDSGERFRRGEDYTMGYQAGEITVLASGSMSDATVYEIDYDYQSFGEFDDGTASPNVTPRIDLPGLWSDFLCKQAARLIIDEVSTPIHTATVTLPNDETGWSVVESFAPGVVPTGTTEETITGDGYSFNYGFFYGSPRITNTGGAALHVKDVENTPQATVLTLGSRRGLSDVVGDIRAQVGAVSQKA